MAPAGKSVPDGTGSVFQTNHNGTVKWCASLTYWSDDGKRRFVRGFGDTPAQAIKRRTANTLKKRRGENTPTRKRSTAPTVTAWLTAWLDEISQTAQRSTVDKYRRDLTLHVLPTLGSTHLDEIDKATLTRLFREDLADLGPSASRYTFANLRAMLNYAVREEVIDSNPMAKMKAPAKSVAVRERDDREISQRVQVAKWVLARVFNKRSRYYPERALIMLMFLGLRRSEILGLGTDSFQTIEGRQGLRIDRQLENVTGQGWAVKPRTKNGSVRVVIIPGEPSEWSDAITDRVARSALLDLERPDLNDLRGTAHDGLMFRHDDTGRLYTYNDFNRLWHEVLIDAVHHYTGLNEDAIMERFYFRPHFARHICATLLIDQGLDIQTIQDVLGHLDSATTAYYNHVQATGRARASDAIPRALRGR